MTELAYLADMEAAYRRSFRATVVALPPGAVVLDRTLFYPAGGGQPCDRGTLRLGDGATAAIVDVVKTGGSALHRLGRGTGGKLVGLRVGAEVTGEIDWTRRHRHMRLHTAQHLVSALIFDRSGLKTRRATMAGHEARIDLDGLWPASAAWEEIVSATEDAIRRPREVHVLQVPRPEWERAPAARSGLVPLPPEVDPVRVIEIRGLDRCPCGGTHVRSTGEIGAIELPSPTGGSVTFTLPEDAPPTPAG